MYRFLEKPIWRLLWSTDLGKYEYADNINVIKKKILPMSVIKSHWRAGWEHNIAPEQGCERSEAPIREAERARPFQRLSVKFGRILRHCPAPPLSVTLFAGRAGDHLGSWGCPFGSDTIVYESANVQSGADCGSSYYCRTHICNHCCRRSIAHIYVALLKVFPKNLM